MEVLNPPVTTPENNLDYLEHLVSRVFVIEEFTIGDPQKDFIVRYRGRLRSEDSISAYEQLSQQLAPLKITPLFRKDEGKQYIILIAGRIQPKPSNPWINLLMFLLTFLSVTMIGGISTPLPSTPTGTWETAVAVFLNGFPFALALMGILVAHEFGHYLAGRYHKVHVTLPYFIPLPLPPFGTMGAFINMKEPPKNRRNLLDIGLAGPLAGVVVAIPVLLLGLSLSTINPLPNQVSPNTGLTLEGNSILYLLLKYITFGQLLPSPTSYDGVSPLIYWLRFFFTGLPVKKNRSQ